MEDESHVRLIYTHPEGNCGTDDRSDIVDPLFLNSATGRIRETCMIRGSPYAILFKTLSDCFALVSEIESTVRNHTTTIMIDTNLDRQ